ARAANGGLIVTGGGRIRFHRDLIVKLAARHKLPAVYYDRVFVDSGGLISYGPDFVDQFRRAAGYVDRILKGQKPAHLPVQAPTNYAPTLNLKPAKALGNSVPESMVHELQELARRDGVELLVLSPSTADEIDAAFAPLRGRRANALLVLNDPFLFSRR